MKDEADTNDHGYLSDSRYQEQSKKMERKEKKNGKGGSMYEYIYKEMF